ncbi:MAG: nitroreductase family protein [Candidatus Aenigmatarchaeota archaeon]
MEVLEAIMNRRSVRSFEDRRVDDETVGKLLTACKWAPSAGNRQPWEVIVVREDESIEKLAELAMDQHWMTQAPVVLVMCINEEMAEATYGERGRELYAIQSTAAAVQNMLIRATDLGLGTCWVGSFRDDELSEFLECEDYIRPVAMIPVGYPEENPEPPRRDDITGFSYVEKFGRKYEDEWSGFKEFAKKTREKTRELIDSLRKY